MASLPEPGPIAERGPVDPHAFQREVADPYRPMVLRGQFADWPAVAAGRDGPEAMARYLTGFDRGHPAEVLIGDPAIAGRFFYNDDLSGYNFKRQRVALGRLVAELLRVADMPRPPALYAGAATAADHLPGWSEANPLDLPLADPVPRVWIGNATLVSTHYDVQPNLACVAAGTRRFTLFPPEQLANLYVGPLDFTIAGPPVSLVDLDAPDLDRFPRFAEAMANAQVAELEPGDAIYIPALWWHNVRASGSFNVLVNYWHGGKGTPSPFPVLAHALMSIRDLPLAERRAWRAWFDHYVFDDGAGEIHGHIPERARGALGAASEARTNKLLNYLSRALAPR